MWLSLSTLAAEAKATVTPKHETVAVLTRYDVKDGYQKQFREALMNYVNQALINQGNIMAEAYFEQEHPLVLWVIERWNNKSDFENAGTTQSFKVVDSLSKNALSETARRVI